MHDHFAVVDGRRGFLFVYFYVFSGPENCGFGSFYRNFVELDNREYVRCVCDNEENENVHIFFVDSSSSSYKRRVSVTRKCSNSPIAI